ncbi:MAG: tyrosine-type recombinase/integrase [Treponema sp.]|nr:tyrosine-type recombinase/integrase [Treponema sp.]
MNEEELRDETVRAVNDRMTANRCSGKYIAEINRHVRQFFDWAEMKGMGDVAAFGKRELLAYRKYVERLKSRNNPDKELSASTMSTMLTAVKHVYRTLCINGHLTENPLHSLDYRVTKGSRNMRRPLTEGEVNFFLDSIDTKTQLGLRDRAIFELIYSSGLRVSEAAGIKIGDINFERREAIVRGKFDRDRMVPLTHAAVESLREYLGSRINQMDENVFLGQRAKGFNRPMRGVHISRIFREYLRKFNMDRPDISTHSLRHSTATHLLDNGASIRHVQELLGHKNIETTVRYTHVQTEGLFRVYRKYHPREHELFDMVDEKYNFQLDKLIENLLE